MNNFDQSENNRIINKARMKFWMFNSILLYFSYCCITLIQTLFLGSDVPLHVAIVPPLAGMPIVIAVIFVYFKFPSSQAAPVVLAIVSQLGFFIGSAQMQRLDFYYVMMLLILCIAMNLKRFKALAVTTFIMIAVNIAAIIFLIPHWGWLNLHQFYGQFVLFLFGAMLILAITHSIEQKDNKAERALAAFSSLLDNTPNYMVIIDSKKKVRYISEPMARFSFFNTQENAVGKPLLDLFRDKKLKLMFADILEADGFMETVMNIDMDGEERYFKVLADKLAGDIDDLFIDITEITPLVNSKKDAEEAQMHAEEANSSKSRFLANMSHEIRTPMNAIMGMSELLLRRNLPDDARYEVLDIKQASSNLLSIINDILDFSKIEAGKLEINPVRYMLSSLINDTINIIRMRLIEKPIRFFTNIDSVIPNALFGDEVRLRQIILNLLSNAVKFTAKGSISMTITEEKRENDKIWLKIIISDTGQGIKDEDQKKLFANFSQVDTIRNRSIEGTGLGLAITKQLCMAMGGDVSMKSEYGKGSEFTVLIPFEVKSSEVFAAVDNADYKKVLIYEGRLSYGESVSWSLNNMGVPHIIVTELEDFEKALGREEWFYIFSGYGLYDKIKPVMDRVIFPSGKAPSIALMVEWGTEVFIPNVRFLSLPVQTISIANTLNGKTDRQDYLTSVKEGSPSHIILHNVNLLVVDDLATNLKVADGLLAPYKADVDTCLSGSLAIQLIKQNAENGKFYDIIFMDHMMPEMDGIEATAIIREFNQTVSIIALTANAVSGMREMFLEKGFNDFLSKPIDVSKLDEIIRQWVPKEKRIENQKQEKKLILLVDNIPENLRYGKEILSVYYNVATAPSMEKMKELLERNNPVVVLINKNMELLQPFPDEIPVEFISEPYDISVLIGCIEK